MKSNHNGEFFKEFLKAHKRIGSVWPSSSVLRKKMLKHIDFDNCNIIVEYGAGTGAFTKQLCKRLKKDTTLLVFELHQPFYENLKVELSEYSNVILINDSAANIEEHLLKLNIDKVDVFISSLPLSNFEKSLTQEILEASEKVLKTNGMFLQYQYSLSAKSILKETFNLNNIEFTPINMPPAFIYLCQKK